MTERKKKSIGMRFAAVMLSMLLFTIVAAGTAFASTNYVNAITITLDVTTKVGETLPDLDVGYTTDSCEVMIPNNEKYDIESAKWTSSSKTEAKIGGTYTMKVTLKALNDYKFSSSYSSSKIKVKNGTYVSASKSGSDRLVVTVKTKATKGDLDAPDEAYWASTSSGTSDFGLAKWDSVEDASYEAYLYRGSKTVYKTGELHNSKFDFFPYMTTKGTYTFKVRSLPSSDDVAAYASKSDWTSSDEIYVDAEDAESAAQKSKTNGTSSTNNTNSSNSSDSSNSSSSSTGSDNSANTAPAPTDVSTVGWVLSDGRWYYRYPDGNYLKNGWGYIGNTWYLFDANGMMLTGWQLRNGTYYYMNSDGKMQTGWMVYKGKWYYLAADGNMVTGWLTLGDKIYYMNSDGAMQTGWININGLIYYFYPDGHKAVNEVIDTFYVDADGVWKK